MLLTAQVRDPIAEEADLEIEVDWESPAGHAEAPFARLCLPPYVFDGPGDAHWIGQRCGVLQSGDADGDLPMVALACGCRARVPWSTLRVVHAEGLEL